MKKNKTIQTEITQIKSFRKRKKKRLNKEKRIRKHRDSIQHLLDNKISFSNIVTWLRQVKRIKTSTFYLHYLIRKKNILVQAEPLDQEKVLILHTQIAIILHDQKRTRTKKFNSSKLDKYASELFELRENGASLEDIRIWLFQKKHLKVSKSTIHNRFSYWEKESGSA